MYLSALIEGSTYVIVSLVHWGRKRKSQELPAFLHIEEAYLHIIISTLMFLNGEARSCWVSCFAESDSYEEAESADRIILMSYSTSFIKILTDARYVNDRR